MELTVQEVIDIREHLDYIHGVGPPDRYYEAAADGRTPGCGNCGSGGEWKIDGDDLMGMLYHLNQLYKMFTPDDAYHIPGL